MAVQIWKAEKEIVESMRALIKEYHPDLFLIQDEIALVFREKAGRLGGEVVLGKSKKASPMFGVLGDTDWKFIIELAADEWADLTARQRTALLDHHLCACRCEEDGDSGEVKCFIAPPDVSMFFDELDRYGDWRPRPDDSERGPSVVEELFGKSNKGTDDGDDE